MNTQRLTDTAKLFADHKGLLAMDESNPTCNKRFAKLNIPQTVEALRAGWLGANGVYIMNSDTMTNSAQLHGTAFS